MHRSCHLLTLIAVAVCLALVAGCRKPDPEKTAPSHSEAEEDASLLRGTDVSTATAGSGAAPAFTLTNLAGESVSLKSFAGKGVILDFWATWCAPCVQEIPHFADIYEANKEKGIVVVGISLDDQRDQVVQFVQQTKVPYPILHGSADELAKVAADYGGIQYIPTTFFIDPNGRIVQRLEGYHDKADIESHLPAITPTR
ncbi:TlpA family protein disulfide reductase [Candidatus Poribacteria bacterium]|nr:TlpA family protein disulfide reductase [Candidatus Poribacteria bacterium]